MKETVDRVLSAALLVVVAVTVAVFAGDAAASQRHALLVGVSSYPSLQESLQLHGPRNDVALMRTLLRQRGFQAKDIRVLADGVPGAGQPTRSVIMGELKALAGKAAKGDFVFLYFAGHGSQLPAKNLGPQNPEPDGLDEMFLPRDVGRWSGAAESVENAIVDDELGAAITAIRNRGAFVWAVFDTCHSGTITRGIVDDGVRYRDVRPAHLGIPDAALDKAAKEAAAAFPRTRGAGGSDAPMTSVFAARANPDAGGFVAFYAAQSWERAPEERLPAGHPDRQSHGVFTFTLAQTLAMNPSMTYRQAAQQVLQRYRARAQAQPTPLFEGPSLDAPVFGAAAGQQIQQWRIEKDAAGGLKVGAGALHQLAEGAVFAVVPNPAARDNDLIGYVSTTRVEVLQSQVAPLAYSGRPRLDAAALPDESYARLVNPNLSLALRVALPPDSKNPGAHDGKAKAALDQLAKEKLAGVAVNWVPAREGGDLRLVVRNDKLWLLPASAELVAEGPHKSLSIDLAANDLKQVRAKLEDSLRAVAKVVNLLKLAAQSASGLVAQKVEISITVERSGKPFTLNPNQVPTLYDRDQLQIRIANRHTQAVDVTLLFIDSQYGITSIFPQSGENNRIVANGQLTSGRIEVNVETIGRESLLMIAAEAEAGAAPADFSFLQQTRLAATRSVTARGAGGDGLREIIENLGFEPERTRGVRLNKSTLDKTAIRLYTWDTRAQ